MSADDNFELKNYGTYIIIHKADLKWKCVHIWTKFKHKPVNNEHI